MLVTINSRGCELLDNSPLFAQLCGLDRRTTSIGRDTVDHAPNGHDDVANSVAGVLTMSPAISVVPEWVVGNGTAAYAEAMADPFDNERPQPAPHPYANFW